MDVERMHYNFKIKFNKIDTAQKTNFLIPEIDFFLNEAQLLFIKLIVEPRILSKVKSLGFESNKRSINDIKNLVIEREELSKVEENIYEYPEDFLYDIKIKSIISNEKCGDKEIIAKIQQHDDEIERVFYKSDYLWGRLNVLVNNKGLLFKPNDFIIKKVFLTYIRKPKYIHYAEGYSNEGYYLDNNTLLEGKQNCELFFPTHSEIVDLAVLLAQDSINPQYNLIKLRFNNLINN